MPTPEVEEKDEDEDKTPDPDHPILSVDPPDPGLDDPESGQEAESDDEVIQQPIPFQMGCNAHG